MRSWMRRGLLACLLWPLSLAFHAVVTARRLLYRSGRLRSTRLAVPVIAVGNIFIGGTGKTPLVIWLVERLREAGYHPGVVSRGYRAERAAAILVTPDSSPQQAGDEPVLIASAARCPVVVDRDRVAAARALVGACPDVDVIVMDDGLQHYRLARDIEILLFDERGLGNGWLLPAGPLREPASRSGDFTVANAVRMPPGLPAETFGMRLAHGDAWQLSDPARRAALSSLAAAGAGGGAPRIVAAAGIGNPSRFFDMLRGIGIAFREMPLPDHHDFSDDSFAAVCADVILITEKDAVKCRQIDTLRKDGRIWVVPVAARVDERLAERILEKLRGHPTA